jgi:hypothetical protein
VTTVAANFNVYVSECKRTYFFLLSSSINYMEMSFMNVLDINIQFATRIACGIVRLLYQQKAVKFDEVKDGG